MSLRTVRLKMLDPVLSRLEDSTLAELDTFSAKHYDQPTRARCFAACLHHIATGDLSEFMEASGVSEAALLDVERVAASFGWKPEHEVFPPPPIAEPDIDRLLKVAGRDSFMDLRDVKVSGGKRSRKRVQLDKQLDGLTPEQMKILGAIMRGEMAIVGDLAFRVTPVGWLVHGTSKESEERTVLKDFSSCTCGDFKFRGNKECKHIVAMRGLT